MTASQLRLFNAARVKANLRKQEPARLAPSTPSAPLGVLDRINAMRAKQDEEYRALEKSLNLEALWPNVFDGPRGVTSTWHGKPQGRNVDGTIDYDLTLRVTNARGCTKGFPQREVPPVLWPNAEFGVL